MKLSIILIAYDMRREIPRTLQSVARTYQKNARELDYEVLLIDNGSPQPLTEDLWRHIDVPVRLITVTDAHSSPASAINQATAQARGELLCLMIDGAHILTPGVFRMAMACYGAFENTVVATRYFWLGPDAQNESIANGYDKAVEDQLPMRKLCQPKEAAHFVAALIDGVGTFQTAQFFPIDGGWSFM